MKINDCRTVTLRGRKKTELTAKEVEQYTRVWCHRTQG